MVASTFKEAFSEDWVKGHIKDSLVQSHRIK
jgi:hypothetical protein